MPSNCTDQHPCGEAEVALPRGDDAEAPPGISHTTGVCIGFGNFQSALREPLSERQSAGKEGVLAPRQKLGRTCGIFDGKRLPLKPLCQVGVADFAIDRREVVKDDRLSRKIAPPLGMFEAGCEVYDRAAIVLPVGEIGPISDSRRDGVVSGDRDTIKAVGLVPLFSVAAMLSLLQD